MEKLFRQERRREGWADVTWKGKDSSYAKLLVEDGSI